MALKFVQTQAITLLTGLSAAGTSAIVTPYPRDIQTNKKLVYSDFGDTPGITINPKIPGYEEICTFTGLTDNGDGTGTLTGLTRNLIGQSPYTTPGTGKQHGATAVVVFSDNPQMYARLAAMENDNTYSGLQTFTQLPVSTGGNATSGTQLVTYAQALALATGTASINRVVVAGTAGETLTAGNLVYLKIADGRWWLCDADTAATVDNIIMGIAQGAGTAGNAVTSGVLLFGLDSNQTGLTTNTAYYASNTAGAISSSVGTVVVSVGISQSTTSIIFYPRYNQQLTEDQQDALLGTSGIPSNTNRYVTDADTSGTGAVQRASLLANKVDAKSTFTAGAAITAGQALHVSSYAQSDGGITLDVQSATAYGSTTNQSMSFTVGNNSNRVLLVAITAASAPSGVTYNGVAMTLVDSQAYGTGSQILYVYRLIAPATGANNIVVTGTSIGGIAGASYYNVDQTTPIDASSKGNSTAGSTTLALTSVTQGAFFHSFYGQGGLSGITTVTTTVDGKYVKAGSSTTVKVANGSNPYLASSSVGKANEVQALSLTSTQVSGSGTPTEAMMNIALRPATAVSIGVVPTNSSAVTLNEPLIDFVGFADSSVAVGASVSVTTSGVVTGLSGLTPGKRYYVQDTNGTLGTSRGTYGKEVGKALTATTLLIAPNKTMGAMITKVTAYQYTAETDGTLTAVGTNAGTLSIVSDGITITNTGTGTSGSTVTMPVSRGKTYTITGNSAVYFTPLQ